MLREESPRRYDFNPLVAGRTEQRAIAGDDVLGPGPECARQELDVISILTGIVRQLHGQHEKRVQCDPIEHGRKVDSRELSPIRVVVPRYSARISAETASSNLSSSQAERILDGGPKKKIAETRTFVSRTTLTARGERAELRPGHPQV